MRILMLFNGRFPSEKAAALFAAEEARSFSTYGEVTIIVPRRYGRVISDAFTYYKLPLNVKVIYVPVLDLYTIPVLCRMGFVATVVTYALSSLWYLYREGCIGDMVVTNEPLAALFNSYLNTKVVFEVHDYPERYHWFYHWLFKRMKLVIATNEWKFKLLQEEFVFSEGALVMERNGVDIDAFASQDRQMARSFLGLSMQGHVIVYTGHLYGWKGVSTLLEAMRFLPSAALYVIGGTTSDIEHYRNRFKENNIHFIGFRPHGEISTWLSAADVLVLPNTAKEEISAHYTSPMKLFEYMASERPIVASDLPSIIEILPYDVGYLARPDDPAAFAEAIKEALRDSQSHKRAYHARLLVLPFSWKARAARIINYLT